MDVKEAKHSNRHVEHSNAFLPLLDYHVTYDEDNVEAVVEYPGLMYDDFDMNTRQPKLWKIMKIFNACDICIFERPLDPSGRTFTDYGMRTSLVLHFVVANEMNFTRQFYDQNVPKAPLKILSNQGYVGTTSLSGLKTMMTTDGQPLVTMIPQAVMVDPRSRRPTSLPEHLRPKAKTAKLQKPLKFERAVRPEGAFIYRRSVAFSDTDYNSHTNWSTYVRFVMDAAHNCSRRGKLQHFAENMKNGVKKMQTLFAGESFEDDMLTTYVWELETDSLRLLTHVCREDSLVCQIEFTFFDSFPTSSL